MTPATLDLLLTLGQACGLVGLGALGVAVLPWRAAELAEVQSSLRVLARRVPVPQPAPDAFSRFERRVARALRSDPSVGVPMA